MRRLRQMRLKKADPSNFFEEDNENLDFYIVLVSQSKTNQNEFKLA
jgi:uncharacterized protein (UPF0305 family)